MSNNAGLTNVELTKIAKRLDEQYHNYAVFCGMSDPALWVLYALYESQDETFTQNDLVSMWLYPKQTINYTVNALVKNGWVRLEHLPGTRNSKALRLTEEGMSVCDEKIRPLMKAEEQSINRLSEKQQELLLYLNEIQCAYFEEEVKKIMGDKI